MSVVSTSDQAIKVFIFSRMKFLAAFILSFSLLVSSSFAVSLTPPLVLKMQEDRTVSASDFAAEEAAEPDLSFFKPAVGVISWLIALGGFCFLVGGLATLNDEDSNAGTMIGIGAGSMGLGGLGMYWAF